METQKTSKIKLFLTFIYILIFPAVLLFLSGNWFWIQGWIFSIWFSGLCYTTIIFLYRHDPALLEERYKQPGSEGEKGWDKYCDCTFYQFYIMDFNNASGCREICMDY